MKLFIVVFTLLLISSSCNKNRTLHIFAKNAVTGTPYPGLTYYVVEEKTGSNGEKYTTVATGELDANGEKMVDVKIKKNRSYTIRVEEPPNWAYNKEISYSYAIQDEPNPHFEFEFAEAAYLKLHVHNTNCIDSNDEIQFRRLWLSINESNTYITESGCYQFDGDFFKLPMGNYKYEWTVTKNGITTSYDSTFTLDENEYFDFTINY